MMKVSALVVLMLLSSSYGCEICPSHEGKDFLVVFIQNFIQNDESDTLSIDVISMETSTVHCFTPYETNIVYFNASYTVEKSVVTRIDIPIELELMDNELSNKSIRLKSDHNIVVYAVNKRKYSGDVYLVYPTDRLGTNYVVATHENQKRVDNYFPALAVSAVEDDTIVVFTFQTNLTFSFVNDTRGANFTNYFSILLKQYETIQILHTELSGTIISANKNILALSGNTFLMLKDDVDGTTGDFIAEQLLPVKYWSTKYVLVPSMNDLNINEIVRVYSIESQTEITKEVGGLNETFSLDGPGMSLTLLLGSSIMILRSSKKIMVAQIGIPRPDINGDPYMLVTNPVSSFSTYLIFLVPHTHEATDFESTVVLIANEKGHDLALLDGEKLNSSVWTKVGAYYVVRISIDIGAHTILTTRKGGALGGYIHGRRHSFGYAMSIGGHLDGNKICQNVESNALDRLVSAGSILIRYEEMDKEMRPSIDPFHSSHVLSLLECSRKCRDHEDCSYFAFQETVSTCFLYGMNVGCSLTDGNTDGLLYRGID